LSWWRWWFITLSQRRNHESLFEGAEGGAGMKARLTVIWLVAGLNLYGQGSQLPLAHVKTDQPQATLNTFMSAMNDYRRGRAIHDLALLSRLDDAVRTLNLDDYPRLLQNQKGREAAIFIKEVIDRVAVINYDKIPNQITVAGELIQRWRLEDTEIVISRVDKGDRAGEYLFSKDTVYRARFFYDQVKGLPYLVGSGLGAGYQEPWFEERLPDWGRKKVLTIALWQWMGLLVFILLGWLLNFLIRFIFSRLLRWAQKSSVDWDERLIDSVRSPVALLLACGLWYIGIKVLQLEGSGLNFLLLVLRLILSMALIWLAYNLADGLATQWISGSRKARLVVDDHLLQMIRKVLKAFVVLLGALVALQNLGFNVFSILAGLGIGGLAVALAAKDALANFFGSLMILMDRPFQVGEWIIVGGAEGTVEEIGFRSTRIRTFYNSVISVPNSELMNAKIDNMGRRHHRRIKTSLRIAIDTPPERVTLFVSGVQKILEQSPAVVPESRVASFIEFGVDYLEILVSFFLDVVDGNQELEERQRIFLEIIKLANQLNVAFAVPTRALLSHPSAEAASSRFD
jgi:MscS family membrane protein